MVVFFFGIQGRDCFLGVLYLFSFSPFRWLILEFLFCIFVSAFSSEGSNYSRFLILFHLTALFFQGSNITFFCRSGRTQKNYQGKLKITALAPFLPLLFRSCLPGGPSFPSDLNTSPIIFIRNAPNDSMYRGHVFDNEIPIRQIILVRPLRRRLRSVRKPRS